MGDTIKELMVALKSMDERLNNRMDKIDEHSNSILCEFKSVRKEISGLCEKQITFSAELTSVQHEVERLKQFSIDSEVVIFGVPSSVNENLFEKINEVFDKYKIEMKESDFKSIYRLRSKDNSTNVSPICINFLNKSFKETIMKLQKKFGPVLLQQIVPNLPASDKNKILIKNRMTPYYITLLKEAVQFKSSMKYEFAWFQNGEVLLKKNAESKIIKVPNKSFLETLMNAEKDRS